MFCVVSVAVPLRAELTKLIMKTHSRGQAVSAREEIRTRWLQTEPWHTSSTGASSSWAALNHMQNWGLPRLGWAWPHFTHLLISLSNTTGLWGVSALPRCSWLETKLACKVSTKPLQKLSDVRCNRLQKNQFTLDKRTWPKIITFRDYLRFHTMVQISLGRKGWQSLTIEA